MYHAFLLSCVYSITQSEGVHYSVVVKNGVEKITFTLSCQLLEIIEVLGAITGV